MMSYFKRFLFLGSISMLLLAGLVFTFTPKASIAHAASLNGCPPGLSENSSSNNKSWVEVLQIRLNNMADNGIIVLIPPLNVDGVFGKLTKAAVSAFQTADSISDGGGAVGNRTWEALGFCQEPQFGCCFQNSLYETDGFIPNPVCLPTQSENSSSNNSVFVQAIQDALNMDYLLQPAPGTFSHTSPKSWTVYLDANGTYNSQTFNAVYDWQANYFTISTDGIVGPQTWNSLGMCY